MIKDDLCQNHVEFDFEHIHSPGLPSSKSSDVSPCPKVTAETRKVKRGNAARVKGSHGEWDKQLKGEVGKWAVALQ